MAGSLRGQCLVAGKHLRDPNFFKTVVLIVEHGEHGAMGLVINRPSSVLVSHALASHFDLPTQDLVHLGGPVEPTAFFILHDAAELEGEEAPIIPGLYAASDATIFEHVVRHAVCQTSDFRYRFFAGCAGWSPDQLEGEIARGDWMVLPACCEAVFHEDPYEIYDLMLKRCFEAHRLVPHACKDPTLN